MIALAKGSGIFVGAGGVKPVPCRVLGTRHSAPSGSKPAIGLEENHVLEEPLGLQGSVRPGMGQENLFELRRRWTLAGQDQAAVDDQGGIGPHLIVL